MVLGIDKNTRLCLYIIEVIKRKRSAQLPTIIQSLKNPEVWNQLTDLDETQFKVLVLFQSSRYHKKLFYTPKTVFNMLFEL